MSNESTLRCKVYTGNIETKITSWTGSVGTQTPCVGGVQAMLNIEEDIRTSKKRDQFNKHPILVKG